MRYRKPLRASILLILVLLVPIIAIPFANAASFVNQSTTTACTAASCQVGTLNVVSGNELIVIVDVNTPGAGTQTIADTLANSWSNPFSPSSAGNIRQKWFIAPVTNAGTDTVTITNGGATPNSEDIDFLQYSGFVAIGASVFNTAQPGSGTGSDALSINVQNTNSMVLETGLILNSGSLSCGTITMTDTQRANTCDLGSPFLGMRYADYEHNALAVTALTFTMSYAGWNAPAGFIHGLVEIQSNSPPAGIVKTTSCFGNCGTPAVTLANTNSTHSTNFNQTLTLLYEFQSTLNGFLTNVTTSVAKSYTASPNGVFIGVYTIPFCPIQNTPFSPQCPGLLQQQNSNPSPPKSTTASRIGLSNLQVPVSNGQWVGIAVSGFFSGLDLNDTNTNVQLFQTNEGKLPSSIQNAVSLGNNKLGLWAFITGNIITGIPPPGTTNGSCFGLDCILASAVNSLCQVVTSTCQTGSSILLIIVLTIISLAVLMMTASYAFPNLNVSTKGLGEFAVLIFIGWFAMFGALNLILPWLMVLIFFVIAWLFLGKARGTGPI